MPVLQRSDLHVNQLLSNVAQIYWQNQNNFVFNQVFPVVPVSKQSDLYKIFNKGDFNRRMMKARARSTKSARIQFSTSNDSYNAIYKSLSYPINDQDRGNADPIMKLEKIGAGILAQNAMIEQEAVFAEKYLASGVWTQGSTGVAGTPTTGQFKKWSDPLSTPIEDIRAAKTAVLQSTGQEPNVLTLAKDVYDQLVDHPDIIDRIKYGQTPGSPAIVNATALAALFEVDKVLVSKAVYNSAAEGATTVMGFVMAGTALLSYAPPAPSIETPSAGYIFAWNGAPGMDNTGIRIRSYYLDEYQDTVLEIDLAQDDKATGVDLAWLFSAAV